MWKCLALCYVLTIVRGDIGDQLTEVIQRCCNDGSAFARNMSGHDCQIRSAPADVPESFGSLCVMAQAQCCTEYYKKKEDCNDGIDTALSTGRCVVTKDSKKVCCDECSRGSTAGLAGGAAACTSRTHSGSADDLLSDDAYTQCCMKAVNEGPPAHTNEWKPEVVASLCEDYAPNELCAHHCIPVPGSYRCECNPGFMLMADGKNCREVVTNRCKPRNPCQHKCNDNGVDVLCSCRRGYELMADKKSCKDIDECKQDTPVCLPGTKCHNIQGSYRCIPHGTKPTENSHKGQCPPGFARNIKNNACDDINECKLPRPPCPAYLCENTVGSYKCGGVSGDPVNLGSTPQPEVEDRCPPGFALGPHGECEDVDECANHHDDCNPLSQFCINTHSSFYCQDMVSKHCPPGFKINTRTNRCEDINECEEDSDICRKDQICVNQLGQYDCKQKVTGNRHHGSCPDGMRMDPKTHRCEDIDECVEGTHLCDQHQHCLNTNGSFECHCKLGYELDTTTGACVDINECARQQHQCLPGSQRCDNTVGSYLCIRITSCGTGYILHHATGDCEDSDECALGTHNCAIAGPEYHCVNIPGSFRCVRDQPSTTAAPEYEYEYYDSDEEIDPPVPAANRSETVPPVVDDPYSSPSPPSSIPPPSSTTEEEIKPEVRNGEGNKPDERRVEEPRHEEQNPEERRPEERRPDERRPEVPIFEEPRQEVQHPEERRPEERRPDERRPEEPRFEEPRHEEQSPEERRPEERRPEERRPEEPRPEEPRPEEPRPEEPRPEEPRPEERRPEERRPEEPRPDEPRPDERRPDETRRDRFPEEHKPEDNNSLSPPYEPPRGDNEYGQRKPIDYIPEEPKYVAPLYTTPEPPQTESPHATEPIPTQPEITYSEPRPNIIYEPNSEPPQHKETPDSTFYDTKPVSSNEITPERPTERQPFEPEKKVPRPVPTYSPYSPSTNNRNTPPQAVLVNVGQETATVPGEKREDGSVLVDTKDVPKNEWTKINLRPSDCPPGFEANDNGGCFDIDECATNRHSCSGFTELCRNTIGGYLCDCAPGFRRDLVTGACALIVTTSTTTTTTTTPPPPPTTPPTTTPVPTTSQTSRNLFWGYPDGRPVTTRPFRRRNWCDAGFHLNSKTGRCEDINECINGQANCAVVEICVNTRGGYRCECPPNWRLDEIRHRCVPLTSQGVFPPGYGNEPVFPPADPQETVGHGSVGTNFVNPEITQIEDRGTVLKCPWGYRLGDDNNCVDVDECATGEAKCGPQQICTNLAGGYTCSCQRGHRLVRDHECEDLDECALAGNISLCSRNADCVNTVGSYQCKCHKGFRPAEVNDKVCVDVDECAEARAGSLCQHRCNNVWGSYRCSCHRGYRLSADNRTCVDVDECVHFKSKFPCVGKCLNEPGSYRCACPIGYRLSEDKRSCIDIDECETGEASCQTGVSGGTSSVCFNTRGSYHCHRISCPYGYELESKHRCTKTERVCKPGDWDCAHQPTTVSYNFITFVSKLYVPDGNVKLFTMRGPAWPFTELTFELRLVNINTPPSVKDRADINAFLLTQTGHEAVISLVRPLEGPQSIELELSMELHNREQFGGIAIAKVFIYVSEYEF